MFATLDPKLRAIELPSRRKVLLSDTVGFIRNLPHTLVTSFRATLEEVAQAEVLLHVRDAASTYGEEQKAQVEKVLGELECLAKPRIEVLNKIDLLGEHERAGPAGSAHVGRGGEVAVSAHTGEGMDALLAAIDRALRSDPDRRCGATRSAAGGRACLRPSRPAWSCTTANTKATWSGSPSAVRLRCVAALRQVPAARRVIVSCRSTEGTHEPATRTGRSITTLSSREVYRNHWMRVREDEILRSNGEKGIYGVVEKDDAAIILPIDEGRVWLVEQFRYTIQERALELPQGGWEMEVDNPEELARGELKEEMGLMPREMTYLGSLDRLRLHAPAAARLPGHRPHPERETRRRGARP